MPGADVDRVREAIEAYLAQHPDAADSAGGIARWWLAGDGLEVCEDVVRDALAQLLGRRIVTARPLPSGEWIYSATRPPKDRAH